MYADYRKSEEINMDVSKNSKRIILVTGATGRQGGTVYRQLQTKGYKVRALVRDPNSSQARQLMGYGQEVFQESLDDPDSLIRAMEGVYGVFSVQPHSANEIQHGMAVIEAAKRQGVSHFVYSSVGSANEDRHSSFREQDQCRKASPIERPTVYDSPPCLLHGELASRIRCVDPERATPAAAKPDDKVANDSRR
jgi:nucleoside-diphosphate-sugar epimerase